LSFAILRAGVFHYRQLKGLCEISDGFFAHVDKRPDHCNLSPGEESDRLHQFDSALIKKGQEKGFYGIIQAVSQGNFIAPHLLGCGVQGAVAHFAAQGTGVWFLPDIKNDWCYFGVYL